MIKYWIEKSEEKLESASVVRYSWSLLEKKRKERKELSKNQSEKLLEKKDKKSRAIIRGNPENRSAQRQTYFDELQTLSVEVQTQIAGDTFFKTS